MPIKFAVAPGTIILCDYDTGFCVPEMVKRRPAVVISPRLPHRDGLCTVVPLSGTPPVRPVSYQPTIKLEEPLPEPYASTTWFAKCDMLATVRFGRLDLFRTQRDQTGRRKYLHPSVTAEQMKEIQAGILHAIGLSTLTVYV